MVKKNIKENILPKGFEVNDLIGLSWDTLRDIFQQLNGKPLTKDELPKYKLMLGFVNATNNSVKTSMQCYKLVSLPMAVKEMKTAMKKRKKHLLKNDG